MWESWWNCDECVRGRVGGIVKRVCGGSWWYCEECVWDRFCRIVKSVCGVELVEL